MVANGVTGEKNLFKTTIFTNFSLIGTRPPNKKTLKAGQANGKILEEGMGKAGLLLVHLSLLIDTENTSIIKVRLLPLQELGDSCLS